MRLPKEISPDSIKDSIVEIRYASKLPFEVLLGIFFQSLDDSYTYTVRQVSADRINISNSPLFYNKTIKFEILPNTIVFNCLDKYIGWDAYHIEIKKVLEQLTTTNNIETFNRIGIRYISQYNNTDLTTITKFDFKFGLPDVKSDNYSFRSEFSTSEFRTILTLVNGFPIVLPNSTEASTITTIDIDVIKDKISIKEVDEVLKLIGDAHLYQKTVFFSILKEDFLDTLNPVY
ncbi:TIGR04255 family protein [Niabella sp. CC-SYL272]|uniref:TIGR04255 family protein n=1 Tax=Niabella agricola TaxID=2891571 RepID=UPI001F3CD88D|nr:TIGR04255 family protein [Niabella agricola]MCF3110919.1 TIGR04255 family protein [Niabella agricola]